MSYPHTIRLRGPWHYEVLRDDLGGAQGAAGKTTVPGDWGAILGGPFRGCVAYRRAFHRPTTQPETERVWLLVEGADARGRVLLGGHVLGEVAGYALPARWEVTDRLAARNHLQLEVELPAGDGVVRPGRESLPGGPVGEVRLEITGQHRVESPAIEVLDGPTGTELRLEGNLVGPADAALEVLLLAEGRQWLCEPATPGHFQHVLPADFLRPWSLGGGGERTAAQLRLLADGRAVWHCTWLLGRRQIAWTEGAGQLFVGPRAVSLPVPIAAADAALGAPAASAVWGLEAIFDEGAYDRCDTAGIGLLQAVPAEWAPAVCPRLAHHPSILAWVAPREAIHRQAGLPGAGGRPWIPRELAFG